MLTRKDKLYSKSLKSLGYFLNLLFQPKQITTHFYESDNKNLVYYIYNQLNKNNRNAFFQYNFQ